MRKCGAGILNPAPSDIPDKLLRVVVNGYRRASAPTSDVVGAGAVEPHIERIGGVCGQEAGSSGIAGADAYSQRAEAGALRKTSSAVSGRRGALINKRALLDNLPQSERSRNEQI